MRANHHLISKLRPPFCPLEKSADCEDLSEDADERNQLNCAVQDLRNMDSPMEVDGKANGTTGEEAIDEGLYSRQL